MSKGGWFVAGLAVGAAVILGWWIRELGDDVAEEAVRIAAERRARLNDER